MNLQPPGNGLFDANRASTQSAKASTTTSVGTTDTGQTGQGEGDTVTRLSPRSERLAALNQEFDIRGSEFRVTPAFIERLESLGFISGDEAQNLNTNAADQTGNILPGGKDSESRLSGLIESLESFDQTLEDDDALSGLMPSVVDSLRQVESRTGQASPRQLESNANRIDAVLNSSATEALPGDVEKQLTQAMDVLMIASRLTQGSTTNAGIEKYLANT